MNTVLERVSDIFVLHLEGEMGSREVRSLRELLHSLTNREWHHFVLNFQKVNHVDYRTLADLVITDMGLQNESSCLKFAAFNPYVKSIFRIAGTLDCCEWYDSVADAILSFDHGIHPSSCPC